MRSIHPKFVLPLLTVLIVVLSLMAHADVCGGHCGHCGLADGCQKVCRLVREDKKVQVTCWGCQSEDFCIPGPSQPGCKHCELVCDDSDAKAPCVQPKKFVWTEWIPGCGARLHTKQKLMKCTLTKTVPSYKWVVENLCDKCQSDCQQQAVPTGADVPPPPKVGARILYGVPAAGLLSSEEK